MNKNIQYQMITLLFGRSGAFHRLQSQIYLFYCSCITFTFLLIACWFLIYSICVWDYLSGRITVAVWSTLFWSDLWREKSEVDRWLFSLLSHVNVQIRGGVSPGPATSHPAVLTNFPERGGVEGCGARALRSSDSGSCTLTYRRSGARWPAESG